MRWWARGKKVVTVKALSGVVCDLENFLKLALLCGVANAKCIIRSDMTCFTYFSSHSTRARIGFFFFLTYLRSSKHGKSVSGNGFISTSSYNAMADPTVVRACILSSHNSLVPQCIVRREGIYTH